MDYSDLKRLAEAAIPGPWVVKEDSMGGEDEVYCSWHKVGPLSFIGEKLSKDTAYVAAASPDVVLRLLAEVERLQSNIDERTGGVVRLMTERDTLRTQNQAQLELNAALLMDCGVLTNKNQSLLEALKDAARSLETISMLAGRATYGSPPIDTYMQHHDEVRGYAASRSGVAFDAIKLAEGKDV